MKEWIFLIIVLSIILLLLCTNPFSKAFERVENDYVRTLAITTINGLDSTLGDAAPGELVTVKAFYAGEKVQKCAWKIRITGELFKYPEIEESEKYFDPVLSSLFIDSSSNLRINDSTRHHDEVSLTFRIPEDIILNAQNIRNDWFNIPDNDPLTEVLTNIFGTIDKKEAHNLILEALHITELDVSKDSLTKLINKTCLPKSNLTDYITSNMTPYNDEIENFISSVKILLLFFETQIQIYSIVNDVYKSVKSLTVRYNSLFDTEPFKEIKNCYKNPVISEVYIVKTRGEKKLMSDKTLLFDIYSILFDTVVIDTGFSYFLYPYIYTPPNIADYSPFWFYRSNQDLDKSIALESNSMKYPQLIPPVDCSMTQFTIWLNVKLKAEPDIPLSLYQITNETPIRYTILHDIAEIKGIFLFTEAYKQKHQ